MAAHLFASDGLPLCVEAFEKKAPHKPKALV